MYMCVCKYYQAVEDGDRRRRSIPLSLFTLSLNSRPATEANGVLIYSWMTHTCRLPSFPNRPVTPPRHMCIYNILLLFKLCTFYTLYCIYNADKIRGNYIFFCCFLFYLHYFFVVVDGHIFSKKRTFFTHIGSNI